MTIPGGMVTTWVRNVRAIGNGAHLIMCVSLIGTTLKKMGSDIGQSPSRSRQAGTINSEDLWRGLSWGQVLPTRTGTRSNGRLWYVSDPVKISVNSKTAKKQWRQIQVVNFVVVVDIHAWEQWQDESGGATERISGFGIIPAKKKIRLPGTIWFGWGKGV